MNVVVIYESLTGNTKRAAEVIGAQLRRSGANATVCAVDRIDYQALSEADLVAVGAWTDGFVMFGQRPGRSGRLKRLPAMNGKRAVVFCTYAIDQGKVLEKLSAIVEGLGADVIGGMAIRRDHIEEGATAFVDRTLAAVGSLA